MAIFVNNNQKSRTIVSLQVSTLSYQSKSVTKCLKFVNEGTTRYIHACGIELDWNDRFISPAPCPEALEAVTVYVAVSALVFFSRRRAY